MIARSTDRKKKTSTHRFLALYIANARIKSGKGEKTLLSWYTGGDGENYQEGLIEVEATQAINTRAVLGQNSPLGGQFPARRRGQADPGSFEADRRNSGPCPGFFRLPATLRSAYQHQQLAPSCCLQYDSLFLSQDVHHEKPYYDHYKLSTVCRIIEAQFGLIPDRGTDKTPKGEKPGAVVQAVESQTGQESFFSYAMRHKEQIMTGLAEANNWQEFYLTFLRYGLVLKVSGNGLAITNRYGKQPAKASGLDRSLPQSKA